MTSWPTRQELARRWDREADQNWMKEWKQKQKPARPARSRSDWPEIFERDGTVCRVPECQLGEVRLDLEWPHPLSPVVDHVVPLSRGGDDTAPNKRVAHAHCNGRKGSKLDSELYSRS